MFCSLVFIMSKGSEKVVAKKVEITDAAAYVCRQLPDGWWPASVVSSTQSTSRRVDDGAEQDEAV